MATIFSQMRDDQLVLLLEALHTEIDSRVCREAYEDQFVADFMRDMANCAANLSTVFEMEADFRPSIKSVARDYFNGNIERARAA